MKLELPSVTLVCVDCEDAERAVAVLKHCESQCKFGAVKFLTSCPTEHPRILIEQIGTGNRVEGLVEYSDFMLKHIHGFVETEHMLIVQHDGWVLNPDVWEDSWMQYDYIGPLFVQCPLVGSGGFSFRSRRLMQMVSGHLPPFVRATGYGGSGFIHEDGVISMGMKKILEEYGCKFAPVEVANRFAYGGNKQNYNEKPFGFHGFYSLERLLGGMSEPIVRNPDLTLRTKKP